ncbi:uncharacterized protein LOC121933256 [Sceloporus undulatus]|uniref:uncharacterized protein LOC121933256 n=1 Tax=Sceloporus undulatus TaxID=8520 RepID=UPI001C4DA8C9|nr:uncharacterized protein LOC121933256 [Sceloporus undulatus]
MKHLLKGNRLVFVPTMDFMTTRRWPGFSLLCVAVLLSLGNGAFGNIDLNNLKTIIDYITEYGIDAKYEYAVAVRLDKPYCINPTPENLETALPMREMRRMHNAIRQRNGLYVPDEISNIVAARPETNTQKHAEWRLLSGGQNSPVDRMLAGKDRQNSCLIFFTHFSPCIDRCLNPNDKGSIVDMVNFLFNTFERDLRAFVFETIYPDDAMKIEKVDEAWGRIKDAPLFRCDINSCILCFNNSPPGTLTPCYYF